VTGRRVHERYESDLDVTVYHEGREIAAKASNLSLGGMYLVMDEQIPYGSQVKVRFRLPALKEDTETTTIVRWNKPDGIGVQFGSLRALEVWGLNQLFKTLSVSSE
jgi:hypothetical protein